MIKCRIIPELVEIWSAYDTAAENFPDTLEPDSVEGRREIISSALNYIKDNGVVPSQQSLGMLQNELIRYDRDNYEGLFGFATNEKETDIGILGHIYPAWCTRIFCGNIRGLPSSGKPAGKIHQFRYVSDCAPDCQK